MVACKPQTFHMLFIPPPTQLWFQTREWLHEIHELWMRQKWKGTKNLQAFYRLRHWIWSACFAHFGCLKTNAIPFFRLIFNRPTLIFIFIFIRWKYLLNLPFFCFFLTLIAVFTHSLINLCYFFVLKLVSTESKPTELSNYVVGQAEINVKFTFLFGSGAKFQASTFDIYRNKSFEVNNNGTNCVSKIRWWSELNCWFLVKVVYWFRVKFCNWDV